jgi:hypothetical protein
MTLPASRQCELRREIPATRGFPAAPGTQLTLMIGGLRFTTVRHGCGMISIMLISGFPTLLVKLET